MFLIRLIFFIFIIGLLAVVFFAFRVYLTVRKMKDQIRRQQRGSEMPRGKQTTTETGETLTDTRSRQRTSQKIIDDSEGEYVDFVEEDS